MAAGGTAQYTVKPLQPRSTTPLKRKPAPVRGDRVTTLRIKIHKMRLRHVAITVNLSCYFDAKWNERRHRGFQSKSPSANGENETKREQSGKIPAVNCFH